MIAVDLPGHGSTPAQADSGTFLGLVGSVERFIADKGLQGVDVVGSSMGARIVLELARRGISREQAYEWVQRNAMRAFHEQRDFKTLLLEDQDLAKVLTAGEIETAFDLDEHFRNVDAIFDRVFTPVAVGV